MYLEDIKVYREFARRVWTSKPEVTPEDMFRDYKLFRNHSYSKNQMLYAICPLTTPDEEIEFFQERKYWRLEDAVSIWLNINPFLIGQFISLPTNDFWKNALSSHAKNEYKKMHSFAIEQVRQKVLIAIESEGNLLIEPKTFYNWASESIWKSEIHRRARDYFSIKTPKGQTSQRRFSDIPESKSLQLVLVIRGKRTSNSFHPETMFTFKICGIQKTFSLDKLGLFDNKAGRINKLGGILFEMSRNVIPKDIEGIDSASLHRLKTEINKALQVEWSLFGNSRNGWKPRFTIIDDRGKTSQRAKLDARRKISSINVDELADSDFEDHENFYLEETPDYEVENDAAGEFLKKHG